MLGPILARMSEQANLAAVAAEVERAEAAASLSALTFACELESWRQAPRARGCSNSATRSG